MTPIGRIIRLTFQRTKLLARDVAGLVTDLDRKLDRDEKAAEDAHRAIIATLAFSPVDGIYLVDRTIVAGGTVDLEHGLARIPKGWLVVDTSGGTAAGNLRRLTTANIDRGRILRLESVGYTTTVTFTVLVW